MRSTVCCDRLVLSRQNGNGNAGDAARTLASSFPQTTHLMKSNPSLRSGRTANCASRSFTYWIRGCAEDASSTCPSPSRKGDNTSTARSIHLFTGNDRQAVVAAYFFTLSTTNKTRLKSLPGSRSSDKAAKGSRQRSPRCNFRNCLCYRADVRRCGAAAAADDIDEPALREFFEEPRGHRWRFVVARFRERVG